MKSRHRLHGVSQAISKNSCCKGCTESTLRVQTELQRSKGRARQAAASKPGQKSLLSVLCAWFFGLSWLAQRQRQLRTASTGQTVSGVQCEEQGTCTCRHCLIMTQFELVVYLHKRVDKGWNAMCAEVPNSVDCRLCSQTQLWSRRQVARKSQTLKPVVHFERACCRLAQLVACGIHTVAAKATTRRPRNHTASVLSSCNESAIEPEP